MAYKGILSGLEDEQLIPASELIKAYLPEQRKRADWRDRYNISIIFMIAGIAFVVLRPGGMPLTGFSLLPKISWVLPILLPFFLLAAPILWQTSKPPKRGLSFDMPAQANRPDPNNPKSNGTPAPAEGHVFLGIERKSGKQVWLSKSKVTQHLMIPGTTGSGKSSMILALIANALSHGSGVLEIDAKGALIFMHQVMALCRIFCRDADFRWLNFMNVDPNISESYNTNTFNMLAQAPADDISSLIASLRVSMGKDNQAFESRGTALVSAVVRSLVWLRDNLDVDITIRDLQQHMTELDPLFRLCLGVDKNNSPYDVGEDYFEKTAGIWSYLASFASRGVVMSYAEQVLNINVSKLRCWTREDKERAPIKFEHDQLAEMKKQHGFATMSFTEAFQNMVEDFKAIFGCTYGDVTVDDAVKNRRIVIAALPALGKGRSTTISASKILIANIRGMAARALGTRTYGNMRKLLDGIITNANAPYLIVFEEAGPYVQDGMEQLYQQARSLNFWIVTCFQDIPGLERNDPAIARSIIGNANYALFMRLQDPTYSGKLAKEMGEQQYTALVRSFEEKDAVLTDKQSIDSKSHSIEKMERITFTDLQAQKVGQATMIAEGKVVRMNAFYCEPLSCIPPHRMTSNVRRFGGWPEPTLEEISFKPLEPLKTGEAGVPTQPTAQQRTAAPQQPSPAPAGKSSPPEHKINDAPTAPLQATLRETTREGQIYAPQQTSGPIFQEASLSDDFENDGVIPSQFEAFDKFYDCLKASEESRIEEDAIASDMSAKRVENMKLVHIWDEFVAMTTIGLEAAASPTASMDLGSMTVGLICLSGIRGRFRRDGKFPPYLPKNWTSAQITGEEEIYNEWLDVMAEDADSKQSLFEKMGPPLAPEDRLGATFFSTHVPSNINEILGLTDEDLADVEQPQGGSSAGDEIRRHLDKKD